MFDRGQPYRTKLLEARKLKNANSIAKTRDRLLVSLFDATLDEFETYLRRVVWTAALEAHLELV